MKKLAFLAAAALGIALPAQQNIVYLGDNDAMTGFSTAFPFGANGVRQQQLVPGSVLGPNPALIQDIFIAGSQPTYTGTAPWDVSDIYYSDFEIRVGTTTAASLSTTWEPTTTVYRGPLRVRFLKEQWAAIGLPVPFAWTPSSPNDNLVVDFINWGVADMGSAMVDLNGYYMWVQVPRARNVNRNYRLGWTGSQPATAAGADSSGVKLGFLLEHGNFVPHGGSCAGSSGLEPKISAAPGTWPQLGSPLDIRLTDGPVGTAALVSFGASTIMGGGFMFPVDLGLIGAPGCMLWHDNTVQSNAVPTDASGNASFVVNVPNVPALFSKRLYATWVCIDIPANNLGLTTSGFATIILGT